MKFVNKNNRPITIERINGFKNKFLTKLSKFTFSMLICSSIHRDSIACILNDGERVDGVTVKYNDVMNEMGIQLDQDEEIDESFVRNILRIGMIWELVCAILSFAGGALLATRQNYNLVLVGCAAAIIGLGGLLLSTLLGALALYLTFQSKPEFGINDQDESW